MTAVSVRPAAAAAFLPCADSSALLFSKVSLTSPGVLTVGSFQGPGITGSNIKLVADPAAAAAMPGYTWPATTASTPAAPAGSGNGQGLKAGLSTGASIGIGIGLAVLAALVIAAVLVLFVRRHKGRRALYIDGVKQPAASSLAITHGVSGAGSAGPEGPALRVRVPGKDSASASDLGAVIDQFCSGSADPAAAALAHGSSSAVSTAGTRALPGANSLSEPLPCLALSGSTGGSCPMSGSAVAPSSVVGSTLTPVDASPRRLSESDEREFAIKQGLQQWNDAVSMHTIRLMQQRLQASSLRSMQRPVSTSTTASSTRALNVQCSRQSEGSMATGAGGAAGGPGGSRGDSSHGSGGNSNEEVRLFQVIGTGSFGGKLGG